MDNDQITALAREYAEWVLSIPETEELPNCLRREAAGTLVEEAEEVLTWLLRRFCLVEKRKVEDVYQRTKNTEKDGEDLKLPLLRRTGRIQRILLESLFPEIAKEVENG